VGGSVVLMVADAAFTSIGLNSFIAVVQKLEKSIGISHKQPNAEAYDRALLSKLQFRLNPAGDAL
jgi:hypothetical protein